MKDVLALLKDNYFGIPGHLKDMTGLRIINTRNDSEPASLKSNPDLPNIQVCSDLGCIHWNWMSLTLPITQVSP